MSTIIKNAEKEIELAASAAIEADIEKAIKEFNFRMEKYYASARDDAFGIANAEQFKLVKDAMYVFADSLKPAYVKQKKAILSKKLASFANSF